MHNDIGGVFSAFLRENAHRQGHIVFDFGPHFAADAQPRDLGNNALITEGLDKKLD